MPGPIETKMHEKQMRSRRGLHESGVIFYMYGDKTKELSIWILIIIPIHTHPYFNFTKWTTETSSVQLSNIDVTYPCSVVT